MAADTEQTFGSLERKAKTLPAKLTVDHQKCYRDQKIVDCLRNCKPIHTHAADQKNHTVNRHKPEGNQSGNGSILGKIVRLEPILIFVIYIIELIFASIENGK